MVEYLHQSLVGKHFYFAVKQADPFGGYNVSKGELLP